MTWSLLHQAHASCGRVLCVFLLALLPLFWSSCEKELARYPEIQQYYTESLTLGEVPVDSVNRFSQKVTDFVTEYPAAAEDPLYPKIQDNIRAASVRLTITITSDAWAGETVVNF